MRRQHPFIPCFPLVLLFVLSGCATEQRLGESRIQSRRYAKGFHVQHHRGPQAAQPERTAAVDRIPVVSVAPLETVVPLEQTGLATSPDRGAAQPIASPAPSLQRPSAEASGAEGVVEQMGPRLPQADGLPEPINGRHPDAVPGFILSLGWFLGGVGALALDYLLVASPGIAFALGLLASIMGLLLSRRAYRISKANPERYPRAGLAAVGRWVAVAFLAPIALYIGLVLLFFAIL